MSYTDDSVVMTVILLVFFAGTAWMTLGKAPDWVRVVVGVSAALVAVALLISLL